MERRPGHTLASHTRGRIARCEVSSDQAIWKMLPIRLGGAYRRRSPSERSIAIEAFNWQSENEAGALAVATPAGPAGTKSAKP